MRSISEGACFSIRYPVSNPQMFCTSRLNKIRFLLKIHLGTHYLILIYVARENIVFFLADVAGHFVIASSHEKLNGILKILGCILS